MSAHAFSAYRDLVCGTEGFERYFWESPVISEIASRCAQQVQDETLRARIFPRLRAEHQATLGALREIAGQAELLASNPLLKRSIRNRFPYLSPLNHVQIELLGRYRHGDADERVRRSIHLSINGIAAGLRNSG